MSAPNLPFVSTTVSGDAVERLREAVVAAHVAARRRGPEGLCLGSVEHTDDIVRRVLAALSAPRGDGDAVREALERLENACDALAAKRSRETYLRMIDKDGATAELEELDNARFAARATLRALSTPVSVERSEQEQELGDCALRRTVAGRASPRASDESRPSGDHQLSEGEK
jgi:hypothetical protein